MLTCFCFISDEGLFEHQFSLKNNKKKVKFQSKAIFLKEKTEILKNCYFSDKYLL